jgi:hypothetical protein
MSSNLDKLASYYAAKYPEPKNGLISFDTQDASYQSELPKGTIHSDGQMELTLDLGHVRGGAKDDVARISVQYNADGSYKSYPSITWKMGGDDQIPDWVTKGLKITGYVCIGVEELAGLFLAPETAGTDEIAVQAIAAETKEITDYAIKAIEVYNDIAHLVCGLADDGGRVYFSAVVSQALNNLNSSVKEYIHNGTVPKRINFKHSLFETAVGNYKDAKDDRAIEYHTDGDYYRTWFPDEGVVYGNSGIMLSCKIDGIRDVNKDDHVALVAMFDTGGNLFAAQAVLQMKNETTVTSGYVTYDTQGRVIKLDKDGHITLVPNKTTVLQAIDNLLDDAMKAGSKHYNDYSSARRRLPKIVQMNLKWMGESIVIS